MDDDGEQKSAQALQLIRVLYAEGVEGISEGEWLRAINYFVASDRLDEDFLPWPR